MIEYNLNIERQLPWGMVASIGYVGSHGVDNFSLAEENPVPSTIVNGTFVFSATCGATNTVGGPTTWKDIDPDSLKLLKRGQESAFML